MPWTVDADSWMRSSMGRFWPRQDAVSFDRASGQRRGGERCHLDQHESREPVNLNDPDTRRALAACVAMPYTGDPVIDERLDLIRAPVAGLEMLEIGRTDRAALRDLLARLDHTIAAAEANVQDMGERLMQLDVQASARGSSPSGW